MSRLIRKDFESLIGFFDDYSISSVVQKDEVKSLLMKLHKSYYALLTFGFEFDSQIEEKDIVFDSLSISSLGVNHIYMKEAISDLGGALFCWVHGAYKNSEMSTRSSIENFIRSIASIENPNILAEKSVYKLFELSKATRIFSGKDVKLFFSRIHDNYSRLCVTTHTGDIGKILDVNGMNSFPVFNAQRASYSMTLIKSTMDLILKMCVLIFSEVYHSAHRRNKEIVDIILPSKIKITLSGGN